MKLKIFGIGLALLLMTACGTDKKESEEMADSAATSETYVPPIGNNTNQQQSPTNGDPSVASQDVQQQQQPITMPTKEITDAEIKKLSKILNQLQQLNTQSQQVMMQTVEKQGLPVQRFMEMQQGGNNPEIVKTITEDEKKKYQAAVTELGKVQLEMRKKMENVLKKEGVTMEEYQQMMIALQTNPKAQQKLMQMSAPPTPPAPKK